MGGSGSGRWLAHWKKDTVEDALPLPISQFKQSLNAVADGKTAFQMGSIQWSRGERVTSSIGFHIKKNQVGLVVRLYYTTTHRNGDKVDSDYTVWVVKTQPNFGGRRWWWICPLTKNGYPCNRRVAKLYHPPGALYYGCRHCYDLTYTSCQENHKYDSMFASLAHGMQDKLPGLKGRDVEKLLRDLYR